jgi:hypothetical protein
MSFSQDELWYDGKGNARAAWLERSDRDSLCGRLAIALEKVSQALELQTVLKDKAAPPEQTVTYCLEIIAQTWRDTGRFDRSFVVPKH